MGATVSTEYLGFRSCKSTSGTRAGVQGVYSSCLLRTLELGPEAGPPGKGYCENHKFKSSQVVLKASTCGNPYSLPRGDKYGVKHTC